MSQTTYLPHADSQASYCDLSYFDYELHEKTWKKIIDQHPFNHKVSLFLPYCTVGTAKKHFSHQQEPFYYQVRLSLVELLQPDFYTRFIKSTQGRLLLHTTSKRLDSDTVVILNHQGHLILSMDKSTYEAFGIVGKAQRDMDRKKNRYVVDIDLGNMGSSMFDRLKWCFENTMTEEYDMVATFVDQGVTKDIEWAVNVKAKKQTMEMTVEEIGPMNIPQLTSTLGRDLTGEMDEQWEHDTLQAMEWIGLAHLNATRINRSNSVVDPFISTYQPPSPTKHNGFGVIVTWTGLVDSSYIINLLVNLRKLMIAGTVQDWASFSVWGYRDSPYTWGNKQHYYRLNGENDYTFILFPPHANNQQSFASMQMYGSQHIFR
ncbi:ribonuclease P 40kDa subunit-domain-containing protein [Chlamydoabsidia padenii]|nr:ribonuclease P 40kDa subunit-domain-containing protein [Chlamydoabsidia padenii]